MPGTVLLLAASPVGKGCLVDAASVLPVLAAVPPGVLAGTDTANVVELADPLEPQAVLTRLRAAAAAPGPLTLFVTGQLQLDRRQHLPHLALARTTPATVRYTGLPWAWLREELRLRGPGSTTLLVDLHADAESWDWLRGNRLDCGPNIVVYGRIAPPPGRRTVATPSYMKAIATLLRSGTRPPLDQLHQLALSRIAGEGEVADLILGNWQPHTAPAPHRQGPGADWAWHQRGPGTSRVSHQQGTAAGSVSHQQSPGAVPVTHRQGPGTVPVPVPHQPTPPGGAPRAEDSPAAIAGVEGPRAALAAVEEPRAVMDAADAPHLAVPAPEDPHAAITAAVQAGRHGDAEALAARWEQAAVAVGGVGSGEALHWMEVRADLAMFAGDAERSCRTWMAVASARLAAGQPVDAPAVEAAVDRAHHQWGRITDTARARELGPSLAELRGRVPGRREGALDHVRRQLRQLQTQGQA